MRIRTRAEKTASMAGPAEMPPLVDPTNRESALTPDDYDQEEYLPSELAKEMVKLGQDRLREAFDARRIHEAEWAESLAYERGFQWFEWNGTALHDLRLKDNNRVYSTNNKIRQIGETVISRAMSGSVSAGFAPMLQRQIDLDATQEAEAGYAHLQRELDLDDLQANAITQAVFVGPCWSKYGWDKTAVIPVPSELGPDGQPTEIIDRADGEVFADLVPCFEMYEQPGMQAHKDLEWLIHAPDRSLEDTKRKYPDMGRFVKPEGINQVTGFINNLLASLNKDYNKDKTETGRKSAVRIENWELPTVQYPRGRYWIQAGDVLLWPVNPKEDDEHAFDWPYQKLAEKRIFPFTYLPFRDGKGTSTGTNATSILLNAQRARNRDLSKIQEHVKKGDGKILNPRGNGVKREALKSAKPDEVIDVSVEPELGGMRGAEPHYMEIPPLDELIFKDIELQDRDMQDMLDTHLVSSGQTPSDVKSGVAIQSLQQSDMSSAAIFHKNVVRRSKREAQILLYIMAEMYTDARLVAVQDVAPAANLTQQIAQVGQQQKPQAMMAVQSFRNLAEGRVIVIATDSAPKSPMAQIQAIQQMFAAHMFDPPQLPATLALLEQMQIEDYDKVRANIIEMVVQLQQVAAQNEQAQQMAQQQAQAAAQQGLAAQAQQHEAQLIAVQEQVDAAKIAAESAAALKLEAFKAQNAQALVKLNAQINMQMADFKAKVEEVLQNRKLVADQQHEATVAAMNHTQEVNMAAAEERLQLLLAAATKDLQLAVAEYKFTHPQLVATADPTGVVSIEQEAGLEGKIPPMPTATPPATKPASKTQGDK